MRIVRPNAGFIIPEKRFVDAGVPAGLLTMIGRYRLTVLDEHGNKKRGTNWFSNLILDSGLNRWGTGGVVTGAAIGTGSAAPDVTQTQLQSLAAWTTTTGTGHSNLATVAGASPYNNSRFHVYRTALGALNGTYSEVGAGWGSANMFSRALILNDLGTPTTINVASDEQLDIEYELQVFPPLSDILSTITIVGVGDIGVTGRASLVNSSLHWNVKTQAAPDLSPPGDNYVTSGLIGAITGGPSGSTGASTGVATQAYSNNSLQRTGTVTFGLTGGNAAGGIRSSVASWNSFARFQYEYDTLIPKDSTKTLVLHYSVGWARRP